MQNKPTHDPSRFETYELLSDGTGFTLKGNPHVFKLDKNGGWFDEFGNYYNADGSASEPPSDSDDDYHSQDSRDHHHHHHRHHGHRGHESDEEDQFEKQFGGPKNFQDEDEPEDLYYLKIASNLATLGSYPAGLPFRINFRNIAFTSKKPEVYNYFHSKVPGILNVVCFENERHQFNGTGYFVVDGIKAGEELIKLEGQKFNGREVSFNLEEAEELLHYPVPPNELYPSFENQKSAKTYINKGKVNQEDINPPIRTYTTEIKSEKKPDVNVHVQKQVKKEELKKEEVKKEGIKTKQEVVKADDQQEFATYIFVKKAFPKKSSFKEWIQLNHFSHEHDIKIVEKCEENLEMAKVTMKRKVYKALNGKNLGDVKIIFNPVQK